MPPPSCHDCIPQQVRPVDPFYNRTIPGETAGENGSESQGASVTQSSRTERCIFHTQMSLGLARGRLDNETRMILSCPCDIIQSSKGRFPVVVFLLPRNMLCCASYHVAGRRMFRHLPRNKHSSL